MISIKISHAGLSQNLSNIAKPNETQAIRKQLANGKEREALLKNLSTQQTEWVKKLVTQQKAGWANDPVLKKKVLVEKGTGIRYLSLDGHIISQPSLTLHSETEFDMDTFVSMLASPDFEKFVEHMYLDTASEVTVGIGHLIPDSDDATTIHKTQLPFYRYSDSKPASEEEVKQEYDKFTSMKNANNTAESYKAFASLYVTKGDALNLCQGDADVRIVELMTGGVFPDFKTFPWSVQQAIADMVYNLGSPKFKTDFKIFPFAIRHRDWVTASNECSRKGIPSSRNEHTKQLILSAKSQEPFFISIDPERRLEKHQFLLNSALKRIKTGDDKKPPA